MVRAVDDDFEALGTYISAYSLKGLLDDVGAQKSIRIGHRIYLAMLTLWAQARMLAIRKQLLIASNTVAVNSDAFMHFREAISDVGSGLFCCIHGAYKAAHMCLRSGIENFLRFVCSPYNKKALTTTSVYELFEIAGETKPFADSQKQHLNALRDVYSQLCQYSHSASLKHMAGIQALSHFPQHQAAEFDTWNGFATRASKAMASVLVIECPPVFVKAHFKIKEVLEVLVPEPVRVSLLKGSTKKGK